jgi:phosphatidylglycerophosphate synthase
MKPPKAPPCATSHDLLLAVGQLKVVATNTKDGQRHRIKVNRRIGAISSLGKVLKPYLDTVGVFVSSNPQYAALAWGSLRLILQVCFINLFPS